MCSVICRVGFEFISLSIQLENISNKPKMNSTRLCKVKLAKLPKQHLKGRRVLALPRPGQCGWLRTGHGSCQPWGCADTDLSQLCHFSSQTSSEVAAYPFHLPGGRARVGKEREFPELGGNFCARWELKGRGKGEGRFWQSCAAKVEWGWCGPALPCVTWGHLCWVPSMEQGMSMALVECPEEWLEYPLEWLECP